MSGWYLVPTTSNMATLPAIHHGHGFLRDVPPSHVSRLRYHPPFSLNPTRLPLKLHIIRSTTLKASGMSAGYVKEELPPALDSSSDPPPIFDGTTKLYVSYTCPYAQRVWITRNAKGLQDIIKLVPIDLKNRPAWYKERVYPPNKVPSLEHDNEVRGESLDLMKYIDSTFEGPSLYPNDPCKREFAEELLSYTGPFYKSAMSSFTADGISEASSAFDYIENALDEYKDGAFFLGEFSLVDIAYAPFLERFQPFLLEVKNYDVTKGRPKLKAWIEEMDRIDAYKETKRDPKEYVENYKRRFLLQSQQ